MAGVGITLSAAELDERISEWPVGNGSPRRKRRTFTAHQKVVIVKRHLVDGVPVSDLCDEYLLLTTPCYQGQKQLFEGGAVAFERQSKPAETFTEDAIPLNSI